MRNSLQGEQLHPVEWVAGIVFLFAAEGHKKPVSDEVDIVTHEARIHADELARQRVCQELLLDLNSLSDNFRYPLCWQWIPQQPVKIPDFSARR